MSIRYKSLYKCKGSWNILGKGTLKVQINKYLKNCENPIVNKMIVIFLNLKILLKISFKSFI
jgi:hypothetical protein